MEIFNRNKEIADVNMLSPLVWAYVGDSVYEMFIRTYLINNSNAKPHKLHIESIKYVKAKAQAELDRAHAESPGTWYVTGEPDSRGTVIREHCYYLINKYMI